MLKLLSFTILWYILWRRNEDNLRVRDNNCTRYFNPRSPCGERLRCSFQLLQAFSISIHAPRAGSDKGSTLDAMPLFISIHAPRAGSDALRSHSSFFGDVFQSTLPVRGATIIADYIKLCQAISIHAPRAGSDDIRGCTYGSFASFQSTLPVRGATGYADEITRVFCISIHAPRAGSDFAPLAHGGCHYNFNPRSPCGERQFKLLK